MVGNQHRSVSAEQKPDTTAFEAFWADLSGLQQVAFEEEAVAAAAAFLQKQ